jgi:hypothetical protein
MGRIVEKNQPCESCGSSDAKQIYEDGSGFCFSCRKNYFAPKEGYEVSSEFTEVSSSWGPNLNEIKK